MHFSIQNEHGSSAADRHCLLELLLREYKASPSSHNADRVIEHMRRCEQRNELDMPGALMLCVHFEFDEGKLYLMTKMKRFDLLMRVRDEEKAKGNRKYPL